MRGDSYVRGGRNISEDKGYLEHRGSKVKDKEVLSDLLFVAEAFDSYTTGRNIDLKKIKAVLEKQQTIIRQRIDKVEQKRILDVADFIVNLPKKDRKATIHANLFLLTRFLIRLFVVLFVLFLVYFFTSGSFNESLVLGLGWGFVAILFLRWISLTRVLEFYEREMKDQKGKLKHLKDGVQKILYLISDFKERSKLSGRKLRLHFYNSDYQNTKIVKRPGILRDYYLVEVI